MQTLLDAASRIGARLKERRETIAVAESSAGGLLSAALLSVPGASAYFVGGGVIYTMQAREALLGITAGDMKGMRSSSEPYALLLARTMRLRLSTTWGLAETGAAGPAGNRYGDQAGHTCVAISGAGSGMATIERAGTLETGHGARAENMRLFAAEALAMLEGVL